MDSIVNVTSGILKGAGKQIFGAVTNFIGYYIIGLPVGVALMMNWGADLRVPGYWWGQVIGLSVQSVVYVSYLSFKINWQETAAVAVKLAAAGSIPPTENSADPKDNEVSEEEEVNVNAKIDGSEVPSTQKSDFVVRSTRRPKHLFKTAFIVLSMAAFIASLVNTSIRYRIDLTYVPNNVTSSNGTDATNIASFNGTDASYANFFNVTDEHY